MEALKVKPMINLECPECDNLPELEDNDYEEEENEEY